MKQRRKQPPKPPTPAQFARGYQAFQRREAREAMYKVATFLIGHYWGKPADMADSLGVLLLTWNQAFYRYGPFDYRRLEAAVEANLDTIAAFRGRDLSSYTPCDDKQVKSLFRKFSEALRISKGKCKGRRSPVAVAKALHLLAPAFFPLWDDKIARAYHCYYAKDAPSCYVRFVRIARRYYDELSPKLRFESPPFTKLFDEYNYARFTKKWVKKP
jgi:hypothetical protein